LEAICATLEEPTEGCANILIERGDENVVRPSDSSSTVLVVACVVIAVLIFLFVIFLVMYRRSLSYTFKRNMDH